MPSDGQVLAFIIYADKAKLSSFGWQKGYPVVARIANLPASIRNGEGIAGRRIVGWLPIVRHLSSLPFLTGNLSSIVGKRRKEAYWQNEICEFQECCLARIAEETI